MKNNIIDLFDQQKYSEVIALTNPYLEHNIGDFELLYYLKSILAFHDFKIEDREEIKKIFFYFFYMSWSVAFENWYTIFFKKDVLQIDFLHFDDNVKEYRNFSDFFDFWKNDIFLNKIVDTTRWIQLNDYREWAIEVDNIVDFFLNFVHECSELYAFKWEHFPLLKRLINELT